MSSIRNRARVFAAVALAWHLMTIGAVSAALSCDQGPAIEHARFREDASAGHAGMAGHEGMADCPLQKKEPACPLHAKEHGTHDCDCPTMGCSQTDAGFMALFGAVGILLNPTSLHVPNASGDADLLIAPSATRLAAVPIAPPPRA